MWLSYAGEVEVEGRGRDEDALAYLRDGAEFRNLLLVELPNGHYGDTVMRQFLFDAGPMWSKVKSTWISTLRWKTTRWRADSCCVARVTRSATSW